MRSLLVTGMTWLVAGMALAQERGKGGGESGTGRDGTFAPARSYAAGDGHSFLSPGGAATDMDRRAGSTDMEGPQAVRSAGQIRELVDRGDLRDARREARTLLRVTERAFGAQSLATGQALDVSVEVDLAGSVGGGGAPTETMVDRLSRSVGIKKDFLGLVPSPAIDPQFEGVLLPHSEDMDRILPLFENAVNLCDQAFQSPHPLCATSLNSFGDALLLAGQYDRSEDAYSRALALRRQGPPPGQADIADTLSALGHLRMRLREYDGALPFYEEALAVREMALGERHPLVATSLSNLGSALFLKAAYPEARASLERAFSIWAEAPDVDHGELLTGHNNIGVLLWKLGDYSSSRRNLEQAIALTADFFGPDSIEVARRRSNLANLLVEIGEYENARGLFESCIATARAARPEDLEALSGFLNNFAILLLEMGNLEEAEPLFEESIRIKIKIFGANDPSVASALNNLGNLMKSKREFHRALSLYVRSFSILETAMGESHPDVAMLLTNLGALYLHTGDLEQAGSMFERGLAIQEDTLGARHPKLATGLVNFGMVLEQQGRLTEARERYGRALELTEASLGSDHPSVANVLSRLARTELATGDAASAVDNGVRAEENARRNVALTSLTLTEREALTYARLRGSGGLDVALSALVENPALGKAAIRSVWDALIQSRAIVFDEVASRRNAFEDVHPAELAALLESLQSAREKLSNLAMKGTDSDPLPAYRELWTEALEERERAERDLALKAASFRRHRSRIQVGFEEILRGLPRRSALLAYVLYQHHVASGPNGARSKAVPSYAAFVLRSGNTEPSLITLGTQQEVDSYVSGWGEEVSWPGTGKRPSGASTPRDTEATAERVYRLVGSPLRERIWDPMAEHLKGVEQVFLVADGMLHLVSFDSLPVGESSYLVEHGPLFRYLSTEKDLVSEETDGRSGSGLLAIGNPDFDLSSQFKEGQPGEPSSVAGPELRDSMLRTSPCPRFDALSFEPLPYASAEAEDAAMAWIARASDSVHDSRTVTLTGALASEAAFKREAPNFRMLHLATHAFFLGGGCRAGLGGGSRGIGGLVGSGDEEQVSMDNPLLLSGLAFAGANHRGAARLDEEDGILTAEEISGLDLRRVETVVLSACDSGIGKIVAGEGVFGLRRAFRLAGVENLVMSLWPVEDRSAHSWMRSFYQADPELDMAESVRRTSLRTLKARRRARESTHPFYWAAFVAAGT